MNYTLRNVTETDKSFIYNVKKASIYDYVDKIWGWDEEYQTIDFENDFNTEYFRIIVVDQKDIGFVQIYEDSLNINIIEIHIIPEYQGNGIGSSIIKAIIKQAVEKRKSVNIGTFIDNNRAKRSYERLGFKVIRITDTHYEMKYS